MEDCLLLWKDADTRAQEFFNEEGGRIGQIRRNSVNGPKNPKHFDPSSHQRLPMGARPSGDAESDLSIGKGREGSGGCGSSPARELIVSNPQEPRFVNSPSLPS